MLKPSEIFAKIPPATASSIFAFVHEHQKPLYKAAVDTLAKTRNLRAVFIEKKPRTDQFSWLTEQVRRRQNDSMAAHVLQIWLVGAHKTLLCDFLDGFNIPHDENGTVESLPESPAREKLIEVIDGLRAKYDAQLLAIYLNAFQSLDPSAWPTLSALIAEDPSLQLS
jgi:hypothetical protein